MKLLVVDDDRDVLDGLATALKLSGHSVTKASYGGGGVQAFIDRGPFDWVLTDYSMPGMNGVEMSLEIRQREPSQKILILTASNNLESTLPDYGLGDIKVLTKPVRMETIEAEIEAPNRTHGGKVDGPNTLRAIRTVLH